MDFELIALHMHGDVQIGSGDLPGLGSIKQTEARDIEVEDQDEESGGKGKVVGMLVLGAALLATAVLARRRMGDEDEEPETVPLAESDQMEATAD